MDINETVYGSDEMETVAENIAGGIEQKSRTLWPGWETVRMIGQGGYGAVYEIRKETMGICESAALKVISIPKDESEIAVLRSGGLDNGSITSWFDECMQDVIREYSLMKEMKGHTNIVYCDDFNVVRRKDGFGWNIFIKMELLTALTEVLKKGDFPEDEIVKLGKDLCRALILCKGKNIVHRDIKPQNIFVSKDGDYKLGDFGIATISDHTTSNAMAGTYAYMAPEVYNKKPYGSKTDIYSLGMVLYWLLNEKRTPFQPLPPYNVKKTEYEDALNRRFNGEKFPPPKHGSDKLKRIILKACEYNPEDRFQSAEEFLNALEGVSEKTKALAAKGVIPEASERKQAREQYEAVLAREQDILENYTNKTVSAEDLQKSITLQLSSKKASTIPAERTEVQGSLTKHKKEKKQLVPLYYAFAMCFIMLVGALATVLWVKNNKMEPETILQSDTAYLKQDMLPTDSEPPATEHPATESPTTESPATEHPATELPATEPPETIPPTTRIHADSIEPETILPPDMRSSEEDMPSKNSELPTITTMPTEDPSEIAYKNVAAHCNELKASRAFLEAVEFLKDCVEENGQDKRYTILLAEYEKLLKDSIIETASNYVTAEQYRLAIHTLDEAWKTYGDQDFYDFSASYRKDFGIKNSAFFLLVSITPF